MPLPTDGTEGLRGIFPAIVTPFDKEGRFQPDVLERLLARLYEAGVHGVYACGSTGEGLLQPAAQRKRVVETAVAASPAGKKVIAHVGGASPREALDLARHAADAGAYAVSSLPPMGGFAFEDTKAYYERLAEASPLPLLLYYHPKLMGAAGDAEQLLELATLPNVIGLKFTAHDLFTLSTLRAEGCTVLNGHDEVLAAGLLMGADGGIGTFYNLVPALFVRLYEHAAAGRWSEAQALQVQINGLIRPVLRFPLFPAVKALLAWSGLDCGPCLPPRRRLRPDEEEALRRALGTQDALRPLLHQDGASHEAS